LGEAQKEQGRVMKAAKIIVAAAIVLFSGSAFAQCVTVAPNICVTKKSYNVPSNEQPFYGFIEKNKQMLDADAKLIDFIQKNSTLEDGAAQALRRGWEAFLVGDLVIAGRRFNQAYLLRPSDGRIYHMYAVLVARRFQDYAYADELYQIAKKQRDAFPSLNVDHGRLLLLMGRYGDALPILQQAVKDAPESASGWSGLGIARFQTGDIKGACEAREQALKFRPEDGDAAILKVRAGCK
jgi:predicted Zn-dependent protease